MMESREAVQAKLAGVVRLLERHRVLETLAERQQTEKRDLSAQMQRRENLVEVQRHLKGTHPADLALILTALPTDERVLVFRQLPPRDAGLTLVELDPEVGETIVDALDERDLSAAIAGLDADDLAYLATSLPHDVLRAAFARLGSDGRTSVIDTAQFPEDSVGRLMRQDVVAARADQTVSEGIEVLRRVAELPELTDRLFVIDARHLLKGSVRLQDLIRADADVPLSSVLTRDATAFLPQDPAAVAAKAFERYDLVSAPVVDDVGKLIGRVTIDAVVDYLRAASDQSALAQAGLRGAEDLFAPVSESVRNRWPWLAVNLFTAFAASRVIGVFEDTISQTVALATLMPIVASVGGNTGNQTIALVIRALALDQLNDTQGRLARKELTVGAVNGLAWGGVVAIVAFLIYGSLALSAVMGAAVLLNLVVAAVAGVAVPLFLRRLGRDPAQGASVILTFVTDGMGFLLFLGLARLVLA